MPAIIGAPAGTYLIARSYKKLTTNPALGWANNYELVVDTPPGEVDLLDLAAAIASFEAEIHLPDTQLDRIVISTWVEDGEPYDPTTFVVIPRSELGTRLAGGQPLSLNNCLFVRRDTAFGRPGKIFYRRVMTEEDVLAPSGTLALANQTAFNLEVNTALTSSGLGAYFAIGVGMHMVMKSALLIDREVTGLTVAGARVIQFNNRYFDVP